MMLIAAIFLALQVSQPGTVNFAWTASPEPDLAGYKLYQGIAPATYGVAIPLGKQTTHTITGLAPGAYYFALTAVDTSANESVPSNEVSAVVTAAPPPSGIVITNLTPLTYSTASLNVGDAFYVDLPNTLISIPSVLGGGLWIKTRHGDRYNTVTGINFTVNQDVTAYVGYDSRPSTLPSWLASGWVSTGDQIGIPGGVPLKVYRRSFPAGPISLGANLAAPAPAASLSMYTVTLQPAAPPPPVATCADGLDNDQDGKIDLADPGCTDASDTDEFDAPPPPPPPPPPSGAIIDLTVPVGSCVTINGVKVSGGLNCP